MHDGYCVVDDFLAHGPASQLLKPALNQLLLLEMESKFGVRRPRHSAEVLTRTDKFLDFSLKTLEGNEELAALTQLARLQFFLPFEINKKAQLNLQVSE